MSQWTFICEILSQNSPELLDSRADRYQDIFFNIKYYSSTLGLKLLKWEMNVDQLWIKRTWKCGRVFHLNDADFLCSTKKSDNTDTTIIEFMRFSTDFTKLFLQFIFENYYEVGRFVRHYTELYTHFGYRFVGVRFFVSYTIRTWNCLNEQM